MGFAPGSNFVLEMHTATAKAKRTIAIVSPAYLAVSRFGPLEWAAAFATEEMPDDGAFRARSADQSSFRRGAAGILASGRPHMPWKSHVRHRSA